MGSRIAISCTLILLATGCSHAPSGGVTIEGMARMAAAASFADKQVVARENCTDAGLARNSRNYARCVTAYHAREAARLRAHARMLADRAARLHGMCLDPIRFEFARCIEI